MIQKIQPAGSYFCRFLFLQVLISVGSYMQGCTVTKSFFVISLTFKILAHECLVRIFSQGSLGDWVDRTTTSFRHIHLIRNCF